MKQFQSSIYQLQRESSLISSEFDILDLDLRVYDPELKIMTLGYMKQQKFQKDYSVLLLVRYLFVEA